MDFFDNDYGFDQYGYQDEGEQSNSDCEDDGCGESPKSQGDSPQGLDFGLAASDWERTGAGGLDPLIGRSNAYLDPRDKAKAEFKAAFANCSTVEADLHVALDRIDEFENLTNLNPELLAVAACFRLLYGGKITKNNITPFVDDRAAGHNPIDVIRYIRFYESA